MLQLWRAISAAFRMCRLLKQVDLVPCECSTVRAENRNWLACLILKVYSLKFLLEKWDNWAGPSPCGTLVGMKAILPQDIYFNVARLSFLAYCFCWNKTLPVICCKTDIINMQICGVYIALHCVAILQCATYTVVLVVKKMYALDRSWIERLSFPILKYSDS